MGATKSSTTDMPQPFNQNRIAIVYDFDGTLSPQPMQEYTVLPKLGVVPGEFWAKVDEEAKATEAEPMLVYMRQLIELAEAKGIHIGREDFTAMGSNVEYFPGVEDWFQRINQYVNTEAQNKVEIDHYIISAGIREILEGVSIRNEFRRVYASEYFYNHHNTATFPKLLITDTTKTQFLFRINKGLEHLSESINAHMAEEARAVPFRNIVYIGDGLTDVPSMAVTRQNGGNAIAVYNETSDKERNVCRNLLKAERVNFIAAADYQAGSILEKRTQTLLRSIITDIEYQQELHACRGENELL